uniref:Thiamine transporter n=1 Tax=Ganoderma boninense TaxID=34458 RepID=A0A5K1JUV0_9APHY|nr:Thiamine transporter [Ganoderma boninense]
MASTRIEINGAQRTVRIYGPATFAFTISSHVRAPLQRVATSVRSVRTLSRQSTQGDIESGVQVHEARATGEEKGNETNPGPSAEVLQDGTEAATSDPRSARWRPRRHSDPEELKPGETWWNRLCHFFHWFPKHIATVVWRTLGICFRQVFLYSIAYMLCGLFLLGLAKGRDGVYANVSALSVVVACACGSGIVAGGCGVLMFVFGTGAGMMWTVEQLEEIACVFIPAIAVGVARGHIRGLTPAFTTVDALKVGGVGLGGFLVCYVLYHCCVDIEGILKSEKQRDKGDS